jgi:hypothetical protein
MILSSLPVHNMGRKTLMSPWINDPGSGRLAAAVTHVGPAVPDSFSDAFCCTKQFRSLDTTSQ